MKKLFSKNTILFRGGIAAIDQGMLSALNFIVQIILIKTIPKYEYGYYSVAFAIILYLVSLQNALINTPMAVLLAGKKGFEKENYVSSVYSGQYFFFIPIILFSLLIITFLYFSGYGGFQLILGLSIILASFGVLMREFLRAYFYAEEQPLKVLKFDFSYAILYLLLIGITYLLTGLSVAMVIIFMGLAAGFDSLILNRKIKLNINWSVIKPSYRENWQLGKWSLVGVTTTHIQSYSHLYLIGALLGSMAMAEVSASRILLVPFTVAMAGWGNVIRPHGARLREENNLKKYFRQLVIASLIVGFVLFTGAVTVSLFSDFLTNVLFTESYKDVFEYIYLWAAIFTASFIRSNASSGLQVIKKFKSLAAINIFTLVITLLLSYKLIILYGIGGALIASLIGEMTFGAALWFLLKKEVYGIKNKYLNKIGNFFFKETKPNTN